MDGITFTGWRTSTRSFSNGNCVECAEWRKSSHSNPNGQCAEVAPLEGGVAIRDTKNRGGPVLTFSDGAWGEFTAAVKRGALPA